MSITHDSRIVELQDDYSVEARPVVGVQFNQLNQSWLEQFCPHVWSKTGNWVYRGYRWHAYSYNYETALSGLAAFQAYAAKGAREYYMYFECDDWLFECTGPPSPDFRPLENDVYVFPRDLSWTFVLTHEMSCGLGPYFAVAPGGTHSQSDSSSVSP